MERSAVAVLASGRCGQERRGSRLIAVVLIAFVSMLLVATFGVRPAMADPDKDKQSSSDQGSSDEDHGKSDEEHGKSDEDHGNDEADKADNSDEEHGKSDEAHGKSDEAHGKSDEEHGKSDEAHGKKDKKAKKSKEDTDDDSTDSTDEGEVAAPAPPARNESKGRPLVLGDRLSRAGNPAIAPGAVRGAQSGAALPFTGPAALIPFIALGLGLMGSGSYLCRKNH